MRQRVSRRWGTCCHRSTMKAVASTFGVALLFVVGCGGFPVESPVPGPDTLPETIILPPPDDLVLTPSGLEPAGLDLSFEAAPVFCCDPLTVEYTALPSDTTQIRLAKFLWDFGDGRTGIGLSVRHTYPWPGEYAVTLVATLSDGRVLDTKRNVKLSVDATGRLDTQVEPGIPVDPVGPPPDDPDQTELIADAGPDLHVLGGETVTLLGRFRPDDGIQGVQRKWSQVGGAAVPLGVTDQSRLTFQAPPILSGTRTLRFQFRVTAFGITAFDEVQVIVSPTDEITLENSAPTVSLVTSADVWDQPVLLTMTGADSDGDDLTFSIVSPPARGRLGAVDNGGQNSATVLYTPAPGFVGTEVFTFRAHDGQAGSSVARFTIRVTGPEAELHIEDATYLVPMNRDVRITVEITAPAQQELHFTIVSGPRRGILGPIERVSGRSASVLYTPPPGYKGTDSFEVRANGATAESNVATIALLIQPQLVPWLEVNSPESDATDFFTLEQGALPGMTQIDYCLAGLEFWAAVTDTVIVTTRVGKEEAVYVPLMAHKPDHVRIIGGIKTFGVPGAMPGDNRPYNFTDHAEWQQIARAAELTAQVTGMNIVVLENETALSRFTRGESPVDYSRLQSVMAPLAATGIETWSWVPWVQSNSVGFPTRLTESTLFVTSLAQALPNNVFMTDYVSWNGWEQSTQTTAIRELMGEIVGEARMQDGLYVTITGWMEPSGTPRRCHTPAEALGQAQVLPGDLLRIYPGGFGWHTVGREFARLLPRLATPVN